MSGLILILKEYAKIYTNIFLKTRHSSLLNISLHRKNIPSKIIA